MRSSVAVSVRQTGLVSRGGLLALGGWLALACFGCSLMGLDEDLGQSSCDSPAFCAPLNALRPTGDTCLAWTCAPDRVCRVRPVDQDGDGAPKQGCAPAGVMDDCDDDNPRRAPTLSESCDTLDNDCDTEVDEDAPFAAAATSTLLAVDAGVTAAHASYASLAGGALAVAFQEQTLSPAAKTSVDVLQLGTASPGASPLLVAPSSLLTPNAYGSTLAAVGGTVVGAVAFAGCTRVVPGVLSVESASFGDFTVDQAAFMAGLPVDDGEDGICPRTSSSKPAAWLSSAAQGSDVLVAWLEASETLTESCDVPLSAPVQVSALRLLGTALSSASVAARTLGNSTASEPPAVVPVEGGGWLVAFPSTLGVTVHWVRVVTPGTGELSSTELFSQSRAGVREVTLGVGATEGTVQHFLLGTRSGCLNDAAVAFLRFGVDTNGDQLVGGTAAEEFLFARSSPQENPRLAFQVDPLGWLVTWTELGRWVGARVASDGTTLAEPSALTNGSERVSQPFVFPLASGTGFGLIGFDAANAALVGAALECSPPT